MRYQILFLICVLGLACTTAAADKDTSYALYLVRHAEKQVDGSKDPDLTKHGIERSERLAKLLSDRKIEEIWSSDYKRTRNTATPLVARLGLDLKIYDPRDLASMAKTLLNRRNNALVVGHSNTTPDLARLLCQCDIDDMDDTEYDRLIVVSITDNGSHVETIQQSNPPKPWPAIAK